MADERGYSLANVVTTYDGDLYLNADKSGFARAKKYKLSNLKLHFKVGDQTYTEKNYVSDGETLTISVDSLDMALNALSDLVANLDCDNNGIIAEKVNLSASEVAALGTTPKQLLAAPGANKTYQFIDIKWACYPTTQLEVGSQQIYLAFDGMSKYFANIYNDSIETSSTLIKGVQIQAAHELGINKSVGCVLSGGSNPTAGTATMSFWLIYKIIDV